MGSSSPSRAGATKTSDLTIWPELRAEGRGRLDGRVGRLVEGDDLEGHALAGSGVEDARDGGMVGRLGHGRSLASAPRQPEPGD